MARGRLPGLSELTHVLELANARPAQTTFLTPYGSGCIQVEVSNTEERERDAGLGHHRRLVLPCVLFDEAQGAIGSWWKGDHDEPDRRLR